MKTCCFIGIDSICDATLGDTLYTELKQILQTEPGLACWFDHVSTPFRKLCLLVVLRLQSQYPHKKIQVVRLYHPDESPDHLEGIAHYGFPVCIPDTKIYTKTCPDKIPDLQRWMLKNCDYIFTYTYPLLAERRISRNITYAGNLPHSNIIPVSCEETNRLITEACDRLSDRYKTILHMLNERKTQREIGDVLGVSKSRVDYLIHESKRQLQAQIKTYPHTHSKSHTGALTGLTDHPSAIQMIAFENLLHFLIDSCHVTTFWMDKTHWNSAYGAVLMNMIAVNMGVSAHVMVCADDDKTAWEHKVGAYAPFYSGIISLASDSADTVSLYTEIMQTCDYFVCDFTCDEAETTLIKELCAQNGDVTLLNVACDTI